jgi:putative oxidoreductase
MSFTILPRSWAAPLLSVMRIVVGLLFLEHGTGKLLGFPHLPPMGESHGMLVFTGAMELVGGALITLGLFTRPAAFVLSGYMAFAYFLAHFPRSFFPVLSGGEPAVLYCFVFLYLAAAGPGPWAIDRD